MASEQGGGQRGRRGGRPGDGRGRDGGGDDLHTQVVEVLLDKVRNDPYPSTTHLDMIEQVMRDDDVEGYGEALLDKVRGDQFPSIDHLRRLLNLA